MDSYKIKLPQFEGPFDLLLFFIERDELDIYDIPIAKLASEFLEYIQQMEMLNIELASEFILVASSLMRIKAKMLLPRKEIDEQGNEIDPREELVSKLMEYKRFKEVSENLKLMEADRLQKERRGNTQKEIKKIAELYSTEGELHSLTLYKLLKSFQKVLTKYETRDAQVVHTVEKPTYTIADQRSYILSKASQKNKMMFDDVFEHCQNRIHAIFLFLALLELIQQQLLQIQVGLGKNNFWISANEPED